MATKKPSRTALKIARFMLLIDAVPRFRGLLPEGAAGAAEGILRSSGAVRASHVDAMRKPSTLRFYEASERVLGQGQLAWFGVRGGAVVALLCAGLYVPHILIHWAHSELYKANQLIELPMFLAIALIVGMVSDRERVQRRKAEQTLSVVCDLYDCFWRVERSTILVRSRYWWLDDPAEPPATAVARWQATLETSGFLGLEEAARIAALSPEQQVRLALRIPEAPSASGPHLRLYASLSPTAQQTGWRE